MNRYNAKHKRFRRGFHNLLWGLILVLGLQISSASAKTIHIVAFGDSLTAGLGVETNQAYPAKLEAKLKQAGIDVTISNAGVSGDTSTGGLARLDWSVGDDVDLVVVELGANDALRGIEPDITRKNLTEIVARLRARGKKILLAGMLAPPNLGEEYGKKFNAIYRDLGKLDGVTLYPFFLEGVALQAGLNQSDGMHPNKAGYDEVVRRLLPVVMAMIK